MPESPRLHLSRRRVVAITAVVALLVAGLAIGVRQHVADHDADHDADALAGCPAGFSRLEAGADPDHPGEAGDADAPADGDADADADAHADVDADADGDADADAPTGPCWKDGAPLPEQLADLTALNNSQSAVLGLDGPGSLAAAEKQNTALAKVTVANARGTWHRVSNGILDETSPNYPAGGYGNTQLAGRMTGYARADNGTVYGGVANGGVWRSTDQGRSWSDIGLRLPSQTVGAIGWTKAGGPRGTLMALTGDNSFGQYNFSGSGLFFTTDEGKHWHLAKGIPAGLLAFKVTVAPDSPSTVYAGTGGGLYRSTDAGRHFTNVRLPTVAGCYKHPFIEKCALSSDVTDVVVRGKDTFGHAGGAVVAAVGWRGGNQKNTDGTPQAPANGLYESGTGKVGSFTKLPDSSGFTPASRVGRVSFGDAYGPDQNHDYLYALVQDSVLLQQGGVEVVPDQFGNGVTSNNVVSYVNGAYVSKDFGKTWTEMENTDGFIAPTTGSSLAALEPLGIAPGVQAWYNNWIQPDPYTQIGGVPTNVMLGLEEIYQSASSGVPQTGPTSFQVVAPYAGGTYACVIAGSPCSLALQQTGITSTHPDQHGILFLPPKAGATREVLVTSDGGTYSAPVPAVGLFKQTDFTARQNGFNTLVPYSFDVSGDGTVVDGMQDNGSLVWHPGDKVAEETYPGDGGTTLIDPKNSDNLIVSLAIGSVLYKNTMGGQGTSIELDSTNNNDITPAVGTRYTYGALARDLSEPNRIMYGGRQIAIADAPIADLTANSWKQVFDLGTRKQPGVASAKPSSGNPELEDSANDLYRNVGYVGYCGACQTITGTTTVGTGASTFHSGIATNAGGKWHIARAKGLPQRLINAVLVDHKHQNTVYVGLGNSTKRQAINPGATGRDGVSTRGGYLYKSTDGGRTFHSIAGNLPKIGVLSLVQYGRQLIVGTSLGAAIGSPSGAHARPTYARLGSGLPAVPVSQMKFRPAHPHQLYVSTFGRGLYDIKLRTSRPIPDPAVSRLRVTHRAGRLLVTVRLSDPGTRDAHRVLVRVRQDGHVIGHRLSSIDVGASRTLVFSSAYHHLAHRVISVDVASGGKRHEVTKKNDRVSRRVRF